MKWYIVMVCEGGFQRNLGECNSLGLIDIPGFTLENTSPANSRRLINFITVFTWLSPIVHSSIEKFQQFKVFVKKRSTYSKNMLAVSSSSSNHRLSVLHTDGQTSDRWTKKYHSRQKNVQRVRQPQMR